MPDITQIKRLDNLEIKFTEQEMLLSELNKIVIHQQTIIDKLIRAQQNSAVQSGQTADTNSKSLFDQLKEERPPHY